MADLFSAGYPEYLHPIATTLAERYDYEREIGAGKNGKTYLIRDRKSGHPYCLKTIRPEQTEQSERDRIRGTLRKEVEILAPIDHRCLPKIHDHDIDADLPFYVCTFHPGMTWEEFRLSGKTLSPDASAYIVSSLIDAIEHLHKQGRTHCDLHQDNILISPEIFAEGLLIIDFGSGHRESGTDTKTPDKGHVGFKNTRGLARHRQSVRRTDATQDFRLYDISALGRALQTMGSVLFHDCPHDQRLAFEEFCALLQNRQLTNWSEVKEGFRHVVDPHVLMTDCESLFVMKDGTRDRIVLPAADHIPVGDKVLSVVNTSTFQRLRGIRQLSFCEWPYPGGTHSRFEHSLGVFGATKRALDHLSRDQNFRTYFDSENVKGALLAGLVHDIGHYPFAHVIEHYAAGRFPGDATIKESVHHYHYTVDLLHNDAQLVGAIDKNWGEDTRKGAIRTLEGKLGALSEVLDSPVDCDKIDYLKRDSYHTGVPYGIGFNPQEVIESFKCSPDRNTLHIDLNRVPAIEGFMVLQDQMLSTVYWHESVRAVFAMFHRFLDFVTAGEATKLVSIVSDLKRCASDYECLTKVFVPLLKNSKYRNDIDSLVRMHLSPSWNDIFRPIAKYSYNDRIDPKNRLGINIFSSIVSDQRTTKMTGLPIQWQQVKRLRNCFREAIKEKGETPGQAEVLVDVPWGKGTSRVLTVVDPSSNEVKPITEVSHLAPSIFENPTAYSAPVRVYLSPRLFNQFERTLESLTRSAEEMYFDNGEINDESEAD